MEGLARLLAAAAVVAACSFRGAAEPGPLSPHAMPPPAPHLEAASEGRPQSSVPPGTRTEIPPATGPTGLALPVAPVPPAGCRADRDCVPGACCHPATCVPAAQAPRCPGVLCTMDCRPATLDCGQARCACRAGACAVRSGS